jgi:Trk K+ transport system NAD-binding subunit
VPQASAIRQLRVSILYTRAIVREFRFTLLMFLAVVALGTFVFAISPVDDGNRQPGFGRALYGAWMAMLAQPFFTPGPWYVAVINSLFPLFGFALIGEGIVRFGLLMVSRRRGEKEWTTVMASIYRDHVILAGLGHLGYRIFEHLHAGGVDIVVLELDENGPFVADAKRLGAPVMIRDMREDQSLIDAGIEHAHAIVIATNADMANIEVAIDARRMNPKIRVLMRQFDQRIAEKIASAIDIDVAFSASALAAPMVAAMSMEAKVLPSVMINGVAHVVGELVVAPHGALVSKRIDEIEREYQARVLARTATNTKRADAPPTPQTTVEVGDVLIVHAPASQLMTLAAASNSAQS